jgi:hypothetical protein
VILQLYVLKKIQFFEILFHVWLLYYYTSLALRENILRVNGSSKIIHRANDVMMTNRGAISDIKSWWIIHHYLSIVVSLTLIMFPKVVTLFHCVFFLLHFSTLSFAYFLLGCV